MSVMAKGIATGYKITANLFSFSGRVINTYGGATVHQNNKCPAIFNFTEDFGKYNCYFTLF